MPIKPLLNQARMRIDEPDTLITVFFRPDQPEFRLGLAITSANGQPIAYQEVEVTTSEWTTALTTEKPVTDARGRIAIPINLADIESEAINILVKSREESCTFLFQPWGDTTLTVNPESLRGATVETRLREPITAPGMTAVAPAGAPTEDTALETPPPETNGLSPSETHEAVKNILRETRDLAREIHDQAKKNAALLEQLIAEGRQNRETIIAHTNEILQRLGAPIRGGVRLAPPSTPPHIKRIRYVEEEEAPSRGKWIFMLIFLATATFGAWMFRPDSLRSPSTTSEVQEQVEEK